MQSTKAIDSQLLANNVESIASNFRDQINMMALLCHQMSASKGFWDTVKQLNEWNEAAIINEVLGNKISLIHSEVSEALEAIRKGDAYAHEPKSEKTPNHSLLAEELADTVIRIFDLASHCNIDLGMAIVDKVMYNSKRPHMHGKKF